MMQATICGYSDIYNTDSFRYGGNKWEILGNGVSKVSWEAKKYLGKFLMQVLLDVQVGNEKNEAVLNCSSENWRVRDNDVYWNL